MRLNLNCFKYPRTECGTTSACVLLWMCPREKSIRKELLTMNNAGFSAVRWDHWLLIVCFLAVASYGMYLSWQWKRDAKIKRARRMRIRLVRQLQMSQSNTQEARPKRSQLPYLQPASRLQRTYSRKR